MIRPDLYKPNADGRFRQIFIRNTLFNQSARKLNLNISFFIFEKSKIPISDSLLEQMSSLEQKVSSMERLVVTNKAPNNSKWQKHRSKDTVSWTTIVWTTFTNFITCNLGLGLVLAIIIPECVNSRFHGYFYRLLWQNTGNSRPYQWLNVVSFPRHLGRRIFFTRCRHLTLTFSADS